MNCDVKQCAAGILETLPTVIKVIRGHILQQQPGGLSLPQFCALSFMDQVKNPSLSTVAEHLALSVAATSRLVNGLVEDRLAERRPVSSNRRQMALTLTKHGKATLEKGRTRVKNRLEETLASLPASDLKILLRGMDVVRQVFDSDQAPKTKAGRVQRS